MSKAFVKDDDADDGGGTLADPELEAILRSGGRNYVTPAGHERLRAELDRLLNLERPEAVAAAAGRLRDIDQRIRFLSRRLEAAEIVDPSRQDGGQVLFGATVTVETEDGTERTYRIVGIDEADAADGRISWVSPVARALLGARPGDLVTLRTPRGESEVEVARITYR